ncbi:MAG TPA: hypothetical protein VFA78_09615 [Chloroflexota bacterium]|nr:hypothetical protein [Chloroflexota bacterium]
MMRKIALLIFVAVAFAGCGGSNFSDQVSALSSSLEKTARTYNASAPTSLAATGSACGSAAGSLRKQSVPAKIPSNATYRQRAVIHAFKAALRGYSTCARSAPRLSYAGMVQATREIGTANSWINRAHGGHRQS